MRLCLLLLLVPFLSNAIAVAQDATVSGSVEIVHHSKNNHSNADVVVSLMSTQRDQAVTPGPVGRLVQQNKRFVPHVLAISLGTEVEFPNKDPFFHDVFSIYQGKPFDLGLYESGVTRKIRFVQPGISYIFCNIHPDMSAVVVVLKTNHFYLTNDDGKYQIAHIPVGRYKLQVWYEHTPDTELATLAHEVEIAPGENHLPLITLHSSDVTPQHLNKYGEPYPLNQPDQY